MFSRPESKSVINASLHNTVKCADSLRYVIVSIATAHAQNMYKKCNWL